MILSTLPDIPGRTYDVIGVVFGHALIHRPKEVERIFQNMVQQASRMGADAIVDIKITMAGDSSYILGIGTAVKLR